MFQPLVKGEVSSVRDIVVSMPSLIKGVRATVTAASGRLYLAPETTISKITTELYNLKSDPRQERSLVSEETDTAKNI